MENLNSFYNDAMNSLLKVFKHPNMTVVEFSRSPSHNCNELFKNTITHVDSWEDLNPPTIEALNSKYAEIFNEDDPSNKKVDIDEGKLSVEERLKLYCNLANHCFRFEEYQKAVRLYSLVLKLFKELHYDFEHPGLVMIYITVGHICKRHGVDNKAIELYSQYLEITIAVFGEEHYRTALAYCKLASAYESQNDHQKSIELLSWSLEVMKIACGERHCEVAALYCSIADAYDKQGEHEDAVTFYCLGLEMQRDILGDTSQDVADTYYRLANSHYAAKDYQKASRLLYFGHKDLYRTLDW